MAASTESSLYTKIIQRLANSGFVLPTEVSPSYFLSQECNAAAKSTISQFWADAHTMSCIKHASFYSSVETTYNDTMLSFVEENDEIARDRIREILMKDCALIESDGAIINSEVPYFKSAVCIDHTTQMNIQQLKAVANLASARLSNNPNKQHQKNVTEAVSQNASWIEFVTSPVRKISQGISYAIDSVLGDEFAQKLNVSMNDAMDDLVQSPKPTSGQVFDEDDVVTAHQLGQGVLHHKPVSNTVSIVSLDAIACSCRSLLAYTNDSEIEKHFFVLRGNNGSVDRIILSKNGCGGGSLASLCHQSGKYYLDNGDSNNRDQDDCAKLLCDSSNEEVRLLAETLVASNHAFIDEDTVTLFPKKISPNYSKCKSDHALFKIHTTRIAIQQRMLRLEQDATRVQQDAVNAKRNGMTKMALMHMKRRKAVMEELERCASLITNLDASELRLQRAKDDIQLVQTFAMLKTALQEIRTSCGMDVTNVEELMSDIQEDINAANLISLTDGVIGPDIDENELNEELQQLELECVLDAATVNDASKVSTDASGPESAKPSVIDEGDTYEKAGKTACVMRAKKQVNDPEPIPS